MKRTRHRQLRSIAALILAVMLVGVLGIDPGKTFAAGGTAKVSMSTAEGLAPGTEFTFRLYKVGHFEGPGLALDDAFKSSGVNVSIPNSEDYKAEDYDGKSWENAWLSSAGSLATYINSMSDKPESIGGEHKLTPGGSFTQAVADNGLYLVVGDPVKDSENNKIFWTPQAMYIMILNGDQDVTLGNNEVVTKLVRTPIAFKHRVQKTWTNLPDGDGADDSTSVKPSEVNVKILYGEQLIDVVKLNGTNSWSWAWESEEDGDTYRYIPTSDPDSAKTFTPDAADLGWSCVEIFDADELAEATGREVTEAEAAELNKLKKRFTVDYIPADPEITDQTGNEQLGINNTYSVTELEITKKLDGFVTTGETSNVTLAFKVTAFDADGNEIYASNVGISFGNDDIIGDDGKYSKTATVTGIPANAAKITVKEVYSAGYTGEGEKDAVQGDDGIWTVELNNTPGQHQGSGVVNKYVDDELDKQEGLTSSEE